MTSTLELDQTDFDAVASELNGRMARLQLSQREVAERADLSVQVVQNLQQGRMCHYRPDTLCRIARAVEWPGGAIARVLAGLPPTAARTAPGSNR